MTREGATFSMGQSFPLERSPMPLREGEILRGSRLELQGNFRIFLNH